jgi:hypothetical protein
LQVPRHQREAPPNGPHGRIPVPYVRHLSLNISFAHPRFTSLFGTIPKVQLLLFDVRAYVNNALYAVRYFCTMFHEMQGTGVFSKTKDKYLVLGWFSKLVQVRADPARCLQGAGPAKHCYVRPVMRSHYHSLFKGVRTCERTQPSACLRLYLL